MQVTLHRTSTKEQAVYGDCKVISSLGNLKAAFHTLENKRYLIAPGYYPLRLTWSPRFNRYMPEVCDVPQRSGLRFHRGTVPEHSRACILLSAGNLNRLVQLLTIAQNENEPAYIEIAYPDKDPLNLPKLTPQSEIFGGPEKGDFGFSPLRGSQRGSYPHLLRTQTITQKERYIPPFYRFCTISFVSFVSFVTLTFSIHKFF